MMYVLLEWLNGTLYCNSFYPEKFAERLLNWYMCLDNGPIVLMCICGRTIS